MPNDGVNGFGSEGILHGSSYCACIIYKAVMARPSMVCRDCHIKPLTVEVVGPGTTGWTVRGSSSDSRVRAPDDSLRLDL